MLKYVGFLIVLSILVVGVFTTTKREVLAPGTTDLVTQRDALHVVGRDVVYFEEVRGYYAAPAQPGSYPGVIMIHEWWGLNDHIKEQAEVLAKEGYQVLAVDLFNGSIATTSDEARAQTVALNQEKALENLKAAKAFLQSEGAERIASLGWCFGGGQSLQFSLSEDAALDATVIYYGNLVTDTDALSHITWPVLGIFGSEDQAIASSTVFAFRDTLSDIGIVNDIYMYPGVGHAFANPSNAGFAPEETDDAWQKTLSFLAVNLK